MTEILDEGAVTWTKEFPSLKYGTWFWLREGPSGTPELRQITGGRAWLEAFGMVSDATEFLGPVLPSDLERLHVLQSQLEQLRAGHQESEKQLREWQDKVVSLMDRLAQVEQERDRLLRGDFTDEELQGFCHNLSEQDRDAFFEGCTKYQERLFGTSAIAQLSAKENK